MIPQFLKPQSVHLTNSDFILHVFVVFRNSKFASWDSDFFFSSQNSVFTCHNLDFSQNSKFTSVLILADIFFYLVLDFSLINKSSACLSVPL